MREQAGPEGGGEVGGKFYGFFRDGTGQEGKASQGNLTKGTAENGTWHGELGGKVKRAGAEGLRNELKVGPVGSAMGSPQVFGEKKRRKETLGC